ncbi:hypothetical protein tinsulaeT_29260 [Thalassotalea insulae]|uniref:Uncharacterized protein n=1 Tax=Thalassotalea insulae TaxID=2056778 RepID=A0ABQ6GUG7_9GAMM|nr:hypothetical protein tinsulaeT_29260 [Thalassotalea insulae]
MWLALLALHSPSLYDYSVRKNSRSQEICADSNLIVTLDNNTPDYDRQLLPDT